MPSPASAFMSEHVRAERDRLDGRRAPRPESAERSAFVSTTTGTAPESHATESSRSMRRRLGGSTIGWTTNTVSILAASTWTSEVLPGSPRVMALVRSSTASMSGGVRWPPEASTATQSPTAGRSAALPADFRRRAEGVARTTPSGVAIRRLPRSPRITRAGVRPSAAWGSKSASQRGE